MGTTTTKPKFSNKHYTNNRVYKVNFNPITLQNIITGDRYISCSAFEKKDISGVSFTKVSQNLLDFRSGRFNFVLSDSLSKDFPGATEANYKLLSTN